MKRISQYASAIVLCALAIFAGCSKSGDKNETTVAKKTDSTALSIEDFLMNMFDGCSASLEIAKTAEASNDPELRKIGEKITSENTPVLESIRTLAENKGVDLTDSLSETSKIAIQKMSGREGEDLTKAVLRAFSAEQRIISSTMRRYKEFDDTEVQAFIKDNKEKFREQAREIRAVKKAVNDSKDEKQKPA